MRFAASLTLLLALALPVAAGDLAFAPAERSPLSGLEQQLERIPYAKEVQQAAREAARPLAKERLRAYLPRGYREQSTKRYGLLVWVSPGRDGLNATSTMPSCFVFLVFTATAAGMVSGLTQQQRALFEVPW